jgi:hypothetical protein
MGILAWFLVGGKYYLHTCFLHTTGLLRYQGPQKNLKRPKKISKALAKVTALFIEILSFFGLMWTVLTYEFRRLKEFDPQGHKGQKG